MKIDLTKDISLNVKMKSSENILGEVEVVAQREKNPDDTRNTQIGTLKLPMSKLNTLPALAGESDVLKVMQLLPGVKKGGEGQTGMYVRGGDIDQNLIILDEAAVYNASHLLGFFSVFNTDALKDVTIIKGGFPANYGGRLSSVVDIRMKEGNMQKFSIEGGIGLLSSRLTVQGPIKKDTCSFIISARRTYIDQVLKLTQYNLPYYFYDINAKINWKFSHKDRFYFSSYYGDDVLNYEEGQDSSFFQFGFRLGNFTSTLRWNHLYNSKLFSNISLIHTRFRYDIGGKFVDNSVLVKSRISDLGGKADFEYFHRPESKILFGLFFTNHNFHPNIISTTGDILQLVHSQDTSVISTQEFAVYLMHDIALSSRLKINYGARFSFATVQNTLYPGIEPRVSAIYSFTRNSSLKIGYSRMKQYMHLVSSSSIALPTDLWYPITKKVQPQSADQFSMAYNYFFKKRKILFSAEIYYKQMNNLIEYRPGTVLIFNNNFENELVHGKGDAGGLEIFLHKTEGKISGWISYALSFSRREFEEINNGKKYFARYDRRHDLSIVFNYEIIKRWSFSAIWTYATGARFTPVIGQFFMPNASMTKIEILPIYAKKNSVVMSPSHRLDLGLTLKSSPKKKRKSEWNLGAYNVYNRTQPDRIEVISTDKGTYKYTQPGLFGFIPYIGYNFGF